MAFLSNKLSLPDLLTKWSATLNPLIASPLATPVLLSDVALLAGTNVINHTLGAKLRGYIVVMNSASATFYDSQNTNPTPALTLILNASAKTTVSLLVF